MDATDSLGMEAAKGEVREDAGGDMGNGTGQISNSESILSRAAGIIRLPAVVEKGREKASVEFEKLKLHTQIAFASRRRRSHPTRGTLKASEVDRRASKTADSLIELINSHNQEYAQRLGRRPKVVNGRTREGLVKEIKEQLAREYKIVPD